MRFNFTFKVRRIVLLLLSSANLLSTISFQYGRQIHEEETKRIVSFLVFFSGAVNGKLKSLIHKMPTKMGFLGRDFKHIFFYIFNPKINWFCIFIIYKIALNKCFLKSFLYMKRKWERFFLLQKLHISKNSKHFLFMHISLYKY